MSWDIFKQRMVQYGENQRSTSPEGYARKFVQEYDQCIKRGHDALHFIPLQLGNTELMESSVRTIFQSQQLNSNQTRLIRLLGTSVLTYWGAATMANFPIPTAPAGAGIPAIPAPGSVSNIGINSNIVLNPGAWTLDFDIFPTTNPNGWLDFFIISARTHLQTVSGLITTTSIYPPIGTPGPGFIFWTGYIIP